MVRQGMGPIPVGQQFRIMKNYQFVIKLQAK